MRSRAATSPERPPDAAPDPERPAGGVRSDAVVGPRTEPVRTCIGCRKRVAAAELFRVVATPEPAGTTAARGSSHIEHGPVAVFVVPDPRRRMPGRGAWLHPDRVCVALAVRRRAVGRALRVPGPVDTSALESYEF